MTILTLPTFKMVSVSVFGIQLALLSSLQMTGLQAEQSKSNNGFQELHAAAVELQDNFQPVTKSTLEGDIQLVRDSLEALEAHLIKSGVVEGWKEYLEWDSLVEQLESSSPDLQAIQSVADLLTANHPGLEQPEFRKVSEALESFVGLLEIQAMSNAEEYHLKIVKELASALRQHDTEPTQQSARTIERGLDWLEKSHQAEELVQSIHDRYSHSNVRIEFSSQFVEKGLAESIESVNPVRERILGANVTGQGKMTGTMTGTLVPDREQATLQLKVTGQINSSTVSRKSGVTVRGTGVTTFQARKKLAFDQTGFTSQQTQTTARSNNRPQNIEAPFFMKPFARMQVSGSQDEVNQVSAQRSIATINKEVDEKTDQLVNSANDAYLNLFRYPLLRKRAFPQQFEFNTFDNSLNVVLDQSTLEQLGAPHPARDFELANDIGIRIHESAINNMGESFLAGRTMTDEALRTDLFEFLTMDALEEYSETPAKQAWALTFQEENPIEVRFRDGAYSLTIAGQKWGAGVVNFQNLNVSVTYRIEVKDGHLKLVRDRDVLIAPPGFVEGKDRLSPLTNSARKILKWKLEQLLPAVIEPDQWIAPGPWKKAGPLEVVDMDADNGWLRISWKMQSIPDE